MEDSELFQKISFFDPRPKIEEFTQRLNKILFKENSNIINCFLTKTTDLKYVLFIKTDKSTRNSNNITFDFFNFFACREVFGEEFYKEYLDKGLSIDDINDLNYLFSSFTFKNNFESLLFSSSFLIKNDSYIKSLYFKFTPDELKKLYIIEDKKLEKKFGVAHKNIFDDLIKNKKEHQLFEIEPYTLISNNFNSIEDCFAHIKNNINYDIHYSDRYYILEYYEDLEIYKHYFHKAYSLVDNDLKKICF